MKSNKIVSSIFETTDYDQFKIIESNREFEVRKNLAEDLKKFGRFEYPILVNEKMEVIDGQHRLATAKYLRLPIQYFVRHGAGAGTVKRINSSAKNWTLVDYVKSYAKEGIEDYKILNAFLENNTTRCLTNTTVMAIMSGTTNAPNADKIRSGTYKVFDLANVEKFFTFIY